ncbi:MAG: arylesterase [Hydrogenophaga sp.]|nr:arylesterase [Hydrogenophaga sp.]
MKRRDFTALALLGPAVVHSKPVPPGPERVLLVLGDSLSAEYGLRRGSGWVALLQERLARDNLAARVVNASISGDTSSGGRSRLPALLRRHQPAVLLLQLGSNDALRGLPLNMTRDNLSFMARLARAGGARVLLLGMDMPPNYGSALRQQFRAVFSQVAQAEQAALVPFLLSGVADRADPTELFQADRIHPNEAAQALMLANVWPVLRGLLPR